MMRNRPRNGAGRRTLTQLAIAAVLAATLTGLPSGDAAASSPPQYPINYTWGGDRYFSPDADGQEDTLEISYDLAVAAAVSWSVADPTGTVVKTGPAEQQEPYAHTLTLDGSGDGGALPNGRYTLKLTATSAGGTAGTTLIDFGITRGPIATLTAPAAGSTVSGTSVPFAVRTGAGLPAGTTVTSVSLSASADGDPSGVSGSAVGLSGTMDTTYATDGANLLSANVSWQDPLGGWHSYATPGVSVTIDNPIRLTYLPSDHYVLTGPGTEPAIEYTLSRPAEVTVTVRDGATVVATPVAGEHQPAGYRDVAWDFTGAGGPDLPEGVYDVTVDATDGAGRSAQGSFRLGIWRQGVGSVVTFPANPVSGELTATFTPSLPDGSTVKWVYFSGESADGQASLYLPSSSGAPWTSTRSTAPEWSLYGYYGGAPDGTYDLTAEVDWTDPLGASHYTETGATAVTVANDVQTRFGSGYSTWLTPDPDGRMARWEGYVQISEPADVAVTVKDADGRTVDTGTADGTNLTWTPGEDLADGIYTIEATATDRTSGNPATATTQVGIDTRRPGTLAAPGALVAGSEITFTPAPGIGPSSITLYRDTGTQVGYLRPGDDGAWHLTLDPTAVPPTGEHELYAAVTVYEAPFGYKSLYSAKVDVAVSNSGRVTGLSSANQWVNPGLGEALSLDYALDSPGTVGIDLLAADDTVAATLRHGIDAHGGGNYFTWDGTDADGQPVPAGSYRLRLSSTGGDGTETARMLPITVARALPGTLTLPAAGNVLAGSAAYEFVPTDGYGVTAVRFCIQQVANWQNQACVAANSTEADGSFRATQSLSRAPQGAYTVTVQAASTDPYGHVHSWTSEPVTVELKALTLPLSVTTPGAGPAPLDATLSFTTSHPEGVPLDYEVDFGDGSARATGTVSAPYAVQSLQHEYTQRGNFAATVIVRDADGHESTRTVQVAVTNRTPTGTLAVSPLKVIVGSAVTATVTGRDDDGDALTYGLTWGDGDSTGTRPLSGGADTVTHTYTTPGTYSVAYVLGDGYVAGGVRAGYATVVVESDQPPAADPGEPPARAFATVPVLFDGTASTPVDAITSYRWDFGDGGSATTASAAHAYAHEGLYTASLTVTVGGRSDTRSIPVTVEPEPEGEGLKVTVTGGGRTLSGALVTYFDPDGSKQQARTDSAGVAIIHGLTDGDYAVYAWQDGYRPGTGTATVTKDDGAVTIALVSGDLGAVALESHRMSIDEIRDAGIDPDDPANQFVFSFDIKLAFSVAPDQPPQEQNFTGFANSDGFVGDTGYGSDREGCTGSCPIDLGGGYQATPQPDFSDPAKPTIVWLVMPVKGSMLKEFFDVQLVVTNLSPGFTMTGGVATLTLGSGLSLAPTAERQALTVTACTEAVTTGCVADIAGGTSQRVRWVVRGDTEGEHTVSAGYDASLEPIGIPVHLATKPATLKVWGATGLQFIVHVQDQAYAKLPYDVTVEVKNITPDATFYNVGLELQSGAHYVFAPGMTGQQQTDTLAPGQSWLAQWQIIPDITGSLDLSQSVVTRVTGGQPTEPDQVVVEPADNTPERTPQLHAVAAGDSVALDWTAIKDAGEYRIYATDDLGHGFVSAPLSTLAGTQVTVPRYAPAARTLTAAAAGSDNTLHYAVMTVVGGRAALRHNVADVLDGFSCPAADQPAPTATSGRWALTGCLKHVSGPGVTGDGDEDVWVARNRARLNGIDLIPSAADGEISLNLTRQSLTATGKVRASLALPDGAGVSVPPITLFEAQPAWDLSADSVPVTLSTPRLLGLPVAAAATISVADGAAADLELTVTPPAVLGGRPSSASLHSDNAGGLHLDSLDIDLSGPGLGSIVGLDSAHLTHDGSVWQLRATGTNGAAVEGTLRYGPDGTLQDGALNVTRAAVAGLFTVDSLHLAASGAEHWTGAARVTLPDGSSGDVAFDLAYTGGQLTAASITASRLVLQNLLTVTDATLTWTAAASTWTITGTATAAGSGPTAIDGTLTVADGTITRGRLSVESLQLGGLATLSQLTLDYSSAQNSWTGEAALAVPGSTTPALHLSLSVVDGVLTQAHADVGRATVAGLLTTTNATFDYVADPGRWQLSAADASLGNLIAVTDLLVAFDAGTGSGDATWRLTGQVDAAASTATVDAELHYAAGGLTTGSLKLTDVHLGGLVDIDTATLAYDAASATWHATAAAADATMDFTVTDGTLQSGHVKVPSATIAGIVDVSDFAVDYDRASGQWAGGGTAAIEGDAAGALTVGFTYADGTLVGGSLRGRAAIMRVLRIDQVALGYDRATDRWSGGAEITLPGAGGATVGGSFVIEHGAFVSGTATADGLDIPLGTGLALRRVDLAVETEPALKLSGTARVATPRIPGLDKDAISVDGQMSYTFGDPGRWQVAGTFKLVDFPLANAHLDYRTSGKASFGGDLNVGLSGVAEVRAALAGSIAPDGFTATGAGSLSVLGLAGASGQVLVDSHGIAACGKIHAGWEWEAGVVQPWGGPPRAIGAACDLSSWEAAEATRPAGDGDVPDGKHAPAAYAATALATTDPDAVSIPAGAPVYALAFTGDTPPTLTLTDPDGNDYPSDEGIHDGPGQGYAVARDATTTYFLLNAPAAGTWTVHVADGSSAVTGTQVARSVPKPVVTASVTGSGSDRTLAWNVTAHPGQRVTFFADDGATSQQLVVTSAATGSVHFTPAPGPAGPRTVRAVVSQDGVPRVQLDDLATFAVGATGTVTIGVSRAGSGAGTVTGTAGGLDCGAACTAVLARDSVLTLTAAPAAGSVFTGWGGACSGTSPTCTPDLAGDRGVVATFGRPGTEPGSGQPGAGDPGTGQPGTGQPGTGQPGTGQPGSDPDPDDPAVPAVARLKVATGRPAEVGARQAVAVRVWNGDGSRAGGTVVRIAVRGANSASGTARTGPDGELGRFHYTPARAGLDTVTATVAGQRASVTVRILRPVQRPVLSSVARGSGTVTVAVQTRPPVAARKVKLYYVVDPGPGRRAELRYAGYARTDPRGRALAVLTLAPGQRYVLKARLAGRDYRQYLSNRVTVTARR